MSKRCHCGIRGEGLIRAFQPAQFDSVRFTTPQSSQAPLTKQQYAEIAEAFDFYDRDKDAKLSHEELARLIRSLGQAPTEAELRQIIAATDTKNVGKVDVNQVTACMERMYAHPIDKAARAKHAFECMDQNHTGSITAADLRHFLTTIGDKLTDDQVTRLFQEGQIAEDAVLNLEAFSTLLGV
ncbi:calmodulin 2 [Pelomyxa schiedti]|nr:calmodulin 2 [Pelomyxa schiedti]